VRGVQSAATPRPPPIEEIFEDDVLSYVFVRNVRVCVWRDAPTMTQMRAVGDGAPLMRKRFHVSAFVNLIVDGTPKFEADVRAEAARQSREMPGGICTAHCILIDGLRASATRAFMSGVVLLARPRVPTKVFGDLDECIRWMTPMLVASAARWTEGEVAATMRTLSARREPPPGR
jgi:hypothetical protein